MGYKQSPATIHIDNPSIDNLQSQINTNTSSLAEKAPNRINVLSSKYGVKADGINDDTVGIQQAINDAQNGFIVDFPIPIPAVSATYLISVNLNIKSNITLQGYQVTIKGLNSRLANAYFMGNNVSNIKIKGFIFDQNQPNLQAYVQADYPNFYNEAIDITNGSNISIEENQFINLYNQAIRLYTCTGFINITKNIFKSKVQNQNQMANHVYVLTFNGKLNIENNQFLNDAYTDAQYGVCGVFLDGLQGKVNVCNNQFDYCGRSNVGGHRLGVIDMYGNGANLTISDNVSTNTCWHFTRIDGGKKVHIRDNKIYIAIAADMPVINVGCSNVSYPFQDIIIDGNLLESSITNVTGIGGQMSDYSKPFKNLKVTNNILNNIRNAIKFTGIFQNADISHNEFDCSVIQDGLAIDIEIEPTATETNGVTQASSSLYGLKVNHNTIIKHTNGIYINFVGYTGTLPKTVQVKHNIVKGKDTTSTAIHTRGVTTFAQGNTIDTGNVGLYLRSNPVTYAFENVLYGFTNPILYDTVTTQNKANNYHNDVAA